MQPSYCSFCGQKTVSQITDGAYMVSYCERCRRELPHFPRPLVMALAVNEYGEAAMMRQGGYLWELTCPMWTILPGETAEQTVLSSLSEGLGLSVRSLSYVKTYPVLEKEQLIMGFIVRVQCDTSLFAGNISDVVWCTPEQALEQLCAEPAVRAFFEDCLRRDGRGKPRFFSVSVCC